MRKTGHEGVPKVAKMHAIVHLFGEIISRIDLPGDMLDVKCLVFDLSASLGCRLGLGF
jgi:hypothetical protein